MMAKASLERRQGFVPLPSFICSTLVRRAAGPMVVRSGGSTALGGLAVVERREVPRYMLAECPDLKADLLVVNPPVGAPGRVSGRLWDLGEGGCGFMCPYERGLLRLPAPGQPMEVLLNYPEFRLRLDAELKHARRISGGAMLLGVSFQMSLKRFEAVLQVPKLLAVLKGRGLAKVAEVVEATARRAV